MAKEIYNPVKHIAEGHGLEQQRQRTAYGFGETGTPAMFSRFVVLETIFDPSIIDDNKISYFEHALNVSNIHLARVLPRNAIVAQRIIGPTTPSAAPAMFLFPFFPPSISLPCQPGEHVWVMFENPEGTNNDLGYWMCRIVEPGFVEDVNHTHPPRANDPSFSPGIVDQFEGTSKPIYEYRNGRADDRGEGRYTIAETAAIHGPEDAYEQLITNTDAGKLGVIEPVPRYRKRPGDVAFEGTNNTLIVLGRDRRGKLAKYKIDETSLAKIVDSLPEDDDKTPGAGMIDLVAGRGQSGATLGEEVESELISGGKTGFKELGKAKNELADDEGDPDLINDRSRILIAQRTKVDRNFGLNLINTNLGVGTIQGKPDEPNKKHVKDSDTGDGAIVVKSDKLRLIARMDFEVLVTGYTGRDAKGNVIESTDEDDCAIFAIKTNGDVVVKPARHGYIKLGGDDADKGIVCSDTPVTPSNGGVIGAPISTTMGGFVAGSKNASPDDNSTALATGQAKFANKVLVK